MKKVFLFSILYFLSFVSLSQQLKFNKIYDYGYATGRSVFSTDSTYFLVGAYAGDNINHPYLGIWKFDTLGNELWYKTYGSENYRSTDALENACKRTNNGYAMPGICYLPTEHGTEIWIRLYNFDNEFDTLWTKDFLHDTLVIIARDVVYCSDGGFAIVGLSKRDEATGNPLPESSGKGLLLRTDSEGNYLWHKTFGEWGYASELHKVVQTPDGGFLCGGGTFAYSSSHNADWYLVKTDSQGNKEWHRTYGSPIYHDTRTSGITITKDTNYVITGGKGYSNDEYKPFIIVLDKEFDLILSKTLPFRSEGSYIGQVIEKDDGFIAIGGDRINESEIVIINLTKFDYNFNEIWRRKYTAYDTTNVDNYMLSVDTCSDGGYVLGGWAAVYDGNGQRLSLIKTDSLGCDGTDWWACSTDAMVNEYVNNPTFTLFPNPAKDFIVIASEAWQSQSIEIYNMQGQLVLNSPFEKGARGIGSQQINIEQLKPGIYFIKVGKLTKKIIKE